MTNKEKIEKLLDISILFTDEQKQAWLNLIPKMNEEELIELHGILADEVTELNKEGIKIIGDPKLEAELVNVAAAPVHGTNLETLMAQNVPLAHKSAPANQFAADLKQQVTTKELPKPIDPIVPKPPVAKIAPIPNELKVPNHTEMPPQPLLKPATLSSLSEIKSVEDLKKVEVANLRQGTLNEQIRLLQSKISSLIRADHKLPFYVISSFEHSQLYKTYLTIGSAMIADPNPDRKAAYEQAVASHLSNKVQALTLKEFEAMADLRKQLEQL